MLIHSFDLKIEYLIKFFIGYIDIFLALCGYIFILSALYGDNFFVYFC